MATTVTLNSLSKSYRIPERGEVDFGSGMSNYLVDLATVVNSTAGGSIATPVYNVKNYGATGDGTTDDTSAIRTAMAALALRTTTGGTLYFPAGTYKVTSTLQFGVGTSQRNVRIMGDGYSSRILQYGAFSTTPLIEFRDVDNWALTDIRLDGANNSGSGDLVLVDGSNYGSAIRTSFVNSQRYGLNVTRVNGTGSPVANGVSLNHYENNASANVFGIIEGNYVVNVREYGAVGDETTDDTAAFQAAIDALVAHEKNFGGNYPVALYIPPGRYRITSTLEFPAGLGLHVFGEGFYNTMLMWQGSAGEDFVRINSSQRLIFEKLTLWGNASAKPNRMLYFDYDPVVFATTGVVIRDVLMDGTAERECFDYGIAWSGGYGNNSEIVYQNVYINKFAEAAIHLNGTQQKSHIFYGCQFNGGWEGDAGVAVGGKYGVQCDEGSYQFFGGGVSSVRKAAFTGGSNDPYIIDGVQTEACYRFLGGDSLVATNGATCIAIRGCRLDSLYDIDPDGYIKLGGSGAVVFEGNSIYTAQAGPWIRLMSASPTMSARITNNAFASPDSGTYSPLINGGSHDIGSVEIHSNTYVKDGLSYTTAARAEFLWNDYTPPTSTAFVMRGDYKRSGKVALYVAASGFKAAALTESIKIFELPKGTKIKSMYVYLYDRIRGGTTASMTLAVGKAASGTTYLTGLDVWTNNQVFYGNSSAHLGTDLSTAVQGGYVPNYFATTDIYATLTATGGNLGNGSVSNLTSGYFLLIMDLEVIQRYVTGA